MIHILQGCFKKAEKYFEEYYIAALALTILVLVLQVSFSSFIQFEADFIRLAFGATDWGRFWVTASSDFHGFRKKTQEFPQPRSGFWVFVVGQAWLVGIWGWGGEAFVKPRMQVGHSYICNWLELPERWRATIRPKMSACSHSIFLLMLRVFDVLVFCCFRLFLWF